jgi:ankyrin repeat protein
MARKEDFIAAVQNGDNAIVANLLQADASLVNAKNERGQSAVLLAAYHGRKEIRDLLIARGATLSLHEASAAGQLARVEELVSENASLASGVSPDGFPVVALAAVFGHFEIAKYLHAKGADINAAATNGTGYNALTGAVTSGQTEIVKWLLENGADPNYRYANGYSPLLNAAANGHLEILKLLQGHGADLRAKTTDGENALSYAEERKHSTVAEYLRAQGLS